jgi:hypothetical protein
MSEHADIAARTQRFNEAARAFTPSPPKRYAKLKPMKEGIVELREKGASLRLIRELLATVDVSVSIDTIGRFLAQVSGEITASRRTKQSGNKRNAVRRANDGQSTPVPIPAEPSSSTPQPASPRQIPPQTERIRTRGPRVTDPRNL